MCTDKIQLTSELEVPCRKCDQCVAARKNTMIARCMAELESAGQALVFTLTYANLPNGEKPLGALTFRDRDITNFLKQVRFQYFEKYLKNKEISFICAGEQGSHGTRRVHWHLILFAKQPLGELGEWTGTNEKTMEFNDIWKLPADHTVNWSLWPHGHVNIMQPTQKGMHYVCKYLFKDQFNVVNAKGTKRITKAQVHAASKVRMSRSPPLGRRFLEEKCNDWEAALVVPPTLNIKIPNYSGYWFLNGDHRNYVLNRLWEINEKSKRVKRRPCVNYAALLAECRNYQHEETVEVSESKDWEFLNYGPKKEQTKGERYDNLETEIYLSKLSREKERASRANVALGEKIVRRCGKILPCKGCRAKLTDESVAALKEQYKSERSAFEEKREEDGRSITVSFNEYWRSKYEVSSGCKNFHDPWHNRLFQERRAAYEYYNRQGHGRKTVDK